MKLEEKITKGVDYLLNQSEKKLLALGSIEKGKFIPSDPKSYKKYKTQIEFRLRFVESVQELLKQHLLLSEGLLEFIDRIDGDGNVSEEDIKGLKDFSNKFKS
tara:strand:+ start:5286 stop:5594 length:309 start_codon:yes stop_codon:yes gene_type:complete